MLAHCHWILVERLTVNSLMHQPNRNYVAEDEFARALLGGRYRCDRLLKTGSGVETFAGVDLESLAPVIIKRVVDAGPMDRAWVRLAHEAEVLRRLETASFRAPVTTGREDGVAYMVRPLVEGVTLAERLSAGPLSFRTALRVGTRLLDALQQAHDHHVLHRDVKPANVIVDQTEPVERVVLIDFGFARSPTLDSAVRDERVGTARYLAPEAAGLLDREVDERSDLYSLGVVLFECLAGRPPFEAEDVGALLRQHLNAPPPSLRELRPSVPRALDAVVQRLLRKDPAERYQSAGAVLADLRLIDAALARGNNDPVIVIGAHDNRPVLTEPAFVGRATELEVLARTVDVASAGEGGVVLLEAESGGGKSRLLDELALRVAADAWVLRGQGVDQGAQRPFQVLDGLVHEIESAAHADASVGFAIRAAVGDRADSAVAAIPDLAATFDVDAGINLGPEAYGETRSIAALSVVLHALGETGRPAVVLLDDCQWADASTLKLLAQWPTELPCRTVVIAAFRTEEVPADHPLRKGKPIAHLQLPAFGPADVESLAESMAGTLPAAAVDAVAALSEGSPFMAAAVLRGLVETGALVHEPRGWRIDEARLADIQTSRRAALFLVRRLELLAPATLEFLTVGAILGKEFDAELAAELCGHGQAAIDAALEEAAQRRIVWQDEGTSRVRFLHDKLREALLSRLAPDERAVLHLRAATRIEGIDADRTFELAYHFDAARRDDLALPYALRAAASARAQHSLDVAVANYRIAESALRASDDAAARADVAEMLGDVLTLNGAYDEATEKLKSALENASTDLRRAALMGKLGEVAFKKGDQRSARVHLEAAVQALGRRLPTHSLGLVLALIVEVVVQAAHSIAPRLFVGRRKPDGAEREFLAIRLYSRLAYCYWFNAGKIACAWAHLREMNLAERYSPTLELAQAYSEHAPVMTMVPWFSRGIRYVQRSLDIRTELGDLWGQGQSCNFYGVVLYAASRQREAIEKLDEAFRLLDQTGDRWEANVALWNKAYAHYRLGELNTAVQIGRRLHESATAMGDLTAAGGGISAWSRASAGQVPAALIRTQLNYGLADAQTDTEVNVAESLRLMSDGDFRAAVGVLSDAAKIVKAAGLRQEYIAPVQPWLATALRMQAEAEPSWDLVERHSALQRGRRAVRAAGRIAFFYRNNLPHALREAALYAAIGGRTGKAQRLFARSVAVAEKQDAVYERLLTLRAWAWTGLDVQGKPAASALQAAEAELALLLPEIVTLDSENVAGPAPSLSLIDRFSTLLAVGREIAAAVSVDAVLDAVHRAATALLRGDHCEVISIADRDGAAPFNNEQPNRVSRTIVNQAIAERRVVVANANGEVLDSSDSIELSGVRSAMCAPVTVQSNVVAIVYVSHAGFQGLFGENEVTMAEFIATLAGAALEHVANTEVELRKMLDEITVTSSLLEATLDATIDGILVVDREGRITSYNHRFAEMWGIPLEVMATRDDHTAIQSVLSRVEDPAAFVAKIDELYAQPEAESYDTLAFKDGRVVERGSKPQRIGDTVVGRVWSFRDVTDRVHTEQALAVARDKAMEASRLKSEFVATTSHEIRTPMNGVIGLTGLLLDTELTEVQREYAEAVRMSAESLLGVINDILDFSKIEAGKLELEDVDFDLPLAVDDVVSLVARGAAAKNLELTWDCEQGVPVGLRGDVGRLRQILLNLLANAVKFTERGGVRVRVINVRAQESMENGRVALRFEVIDTGVGLMPEDRDRLFQPFSQADASTTRKFGGTGLGLAICARLAEAMGGEIGVESDFGVGSTFWVEIPFSVVAAPAVREKLATPALLRPRTSEHRVGRVLVAEDNAINQLVAKEMIRRLGYECDVVGNGAEALEALRLRRYAAVLMDCYMPEMDGFAATRELRERERHANAGRTPVIAMTALAMAEDRERCTESGMDDYVSKPVNLMALGATLERWVPSRAVAAG
jgi:two-component system sensor kinase